MGTATIEAVHRETAQQQQRTLEVRNVRVDSIRVGERLRPLGDTSSLVESIREVGLLNPISITRNRHLISGLHRLEAFRFLGRKHIPAIVLNVSQQEARLREIDENLARNDLTLLERAKHLAAYLDEMTFRFNRRNRRDIFVDTLRHMVTADPLTFEKLTA